MNFLSSAIRKSLSSQLATATKQRFFQSSAVCWEKLNLQGLAEKVDLEGQNVLVRVDLNVPLAKVRECTKGEYEIYICWALLFAVLFTVGLKTTVLSAPFFPMLS